MSYRVSFRERKTTERPWRLEILQPDGAWWVQSTYSTADRAGSVMVDLENLWADDFPDIRMRVIHRDEAAS